jgi:hypothetical protein
MVPSSAASSRALATLGTRSSPSGRLRGPKHPTADLAHRRSVPGPGGEGARGSGNRCGSTVVVSDGFVGIAAVVRTRVGVDGGIGEAWYIVEEGMAGSLGDGVALGHGDVLVHDNVGFPM